MHSMHDAKAPQQLWPVASRGIRVQDGSHVTVPIPV